MGSSKRDVDAGDVVYLNGMINKILYALGSFFIELFIRRVVRQLEKETGAEVLRMKLSFGPGDDSLDGSEAIGIRGDGQTTVYDSIDQALNDPDAFWKDWDYEEDDPG